MKFVTSLAFSDPTQLCELARAADEAGWDGLVVSDHVVHPEKIATPYPYTKDGAPRWQAPAPWPDPWVAIGAMAAVTRRIRFLTGHLRAADAQPLQRGEGGGHGRGALGRSRDARSRRRLDARGVRAARAAVRAARRAHGRDDRGDAQALARRHGRASRPLLRFPAPPDEPGSGGADPDPDRRRLGRRAAARGPDRRRLDLRHPHRRGAARDRREDPASTGAKRAARNAPLEIVAACQRRLRRGRLPTPRGHRRHHVSRPCHGSSMAGRPSRSTRSWKGCGASPTT